MEGTPSAGLTFRHADGTPYGGAPSPYRSDIRAKAHRALTQMGFRETATRRALARVPVNSAVSLEQLVRLALGELGSQSAA